MCTAISYKTGTHYFGRNLDLEFSYDETVTITPRNYKFRFRHVSAPETLYAMIGMAYVQEDYPLYYDATNEKGLSMAGLNFPENAVYKPFTQGFDNLASFEFIPWVLCQCETVEDARHLLSRINIVSENFSSTLAASPLHWIISDCCSSIVVESVREGLKIYDNPVHVLTNNPQFNIQMWNLNNYMNVSASDPANCFSDRLPLTYYSRGMGGIGLPGDLSSASRFVKSAFVLHNSAPADSRDEDVNQFFHILASVAQPKGCVLVNGKYEHTIYSSCCDTEKGIYYYTTYNNSRITAIDMSKEDLTSNQLVCYKLRTGCDILHEN